MPRRRDDWDDEDDDNRPRRRLRRRPKSGGGGVPAVVWVGGAVTLAAVVATLAVVAAKRPSDPTAPAAAGGPLAGLPGLPPPPAADPNAFPPDQEAVWRRLVGEPWHQSASGTRRTWRFTADRLVVREQASGGGPPAPFTDRALGVRSAGGRFAVQLGLVTTDGFKKPSGELGELWFDGADLVHVEPHTRQTLRFTRGGSAGPAAAGVTRRPRLKLTPPAVADPADKRFVEQMWVIPEDLGAGGVDLPADEALGLLQGSWRRRPLPPGTPVLDLHPSRLTYRGTTETAVLNYAELTKGVTPDQVATSEVIDLQSRHGWVGLLNRHPNIPVPTGDFLRFRGDDELDLVVTRAGPGAGRTMLTYVRE